MKPFTLSLIILIISISCNHKRDNKSTNGLSEDGKYDLLPPNDLYNYATNYIPKSILLNVSINDSLSKYNLNYQSFDSLNLAYFDKSIYIILLKQYLYQITIAHQGYNLKEMNTGYASAILRRFGEINNINFNDKKIEFIHSGVVFEMAQKNNSICSDSTIVKIVREIQLINNN